MAAVHIRDIPTQVLEVLKRRAHRHQRSLQGELRHILTTVAQEEPSAEPSPPLQLHFSESRPQITWSREEIYGDDGR